MAVPTSSVMATFRDRGQAQQAVRELRGAGFPEDQIGLITKDLSQAAKDSRSAAAGSEWKERAVTGGVTGAGIGGLWALGIAAGVLPAVGPVLAGGLLTSVVASAAGGALVGGLVGTLVGLGIPEDDAQHYEKEFRSGRTLVVVQPGNRRDEAAAVLQRSGGEMRTTETKSSSTVLPPAQPNPPWRVGRNTEHPAETAGGSRRSRS
jgi:hypothetical protein